jgi:hypothetical protein
MISNVDVVAPECDTRMSESFRATWEGNENVTLLILLCGLGVTDLPGGTKWNQLKNNPNEASCGFAPLVRIGSFCMSELHTRPLATTR